MTILWKYICPHSFEIRVSAKWKDAGRVWIVLFYTIWFTLRSLYVYYNLLEKITHTIFQSVFIRLLHFNEIRVVAIIN